ncbi:surface-adhesin E family protein [Methylobacillus methanolivorans]|uniref:Surface-adhesin E family protein n=1 Tax=Methylobacillus methanolivorans TaxID=1848927 RepID=A0ABW8GHY8_9PROT
MRSVWWTCLLVAGFAMSAEQWELAGESAVGKHYVDQASVVRQAAEHKLIVQTKVEQADGSVWVTTMQLDCKAKRFSYLQGFQLKDGKPVVKFDAPRAEEPISPGSLPDQLQQRYCVAPASQSTVTSQPRWEVVSNSNTGEVALDRASLQTLPGQVFTVNTRVKPFNKNEQTLSTLQFNCGEGTFRILQAQKVRDGRAETLFDKPPPVAPVSKSATAQQLAKAICSPAIKPARNPFQEDACKGTLNDLQALERRVQGDIDAHALYCDTMQQYLDQLARIADDVDKNHCAIHGLDQYQREIRTAGCEASPNEQ